MYRSLVVLIPLALGLAGCNSDNTRDDNTTVTPMHVVDIEKEDTNVNLPEGELVVFLGRPTGKGASRRENTLSLGYTRGVSRFDSELSDTQYIDIQGDKITGPAILENEAALGVAYLRYVRHMYITEHKEWYWGAGLGHANLGFKTSDGTQTLRDDDNAAGVHALMGLVYHFNAVIGMEGSLGGYYFPSDTADDKTLYDARLQLNLSPAEAVKLFAGYRYWGGYVYNSDDSRTDIELDLSGPTAGVTLKF